MIRNEFNPQQKYTYVRYGRMSDPHQNSRSPDQQFAETDRVLKQVGFPWQHCQDYRDDGISGRLFYRRPELQRMLRELKTGLVVADLILVDTPERFGRLDELEQIRRDLYRHHGILVLSANTLFADPNTPQGRAYGAVDGIRATEEGRIKASHVLRGKRDAIQLKRWPGGPVPFGYRLKEVVDQQPGGTRVYNILAPDPETCWIVALAFELAHQNGWGGSRVAGALNAVPRVQSKNVRFKSTTVGGWLKNPIYRGACIWPDVATDIIDDCRVIQQVPDEEKIRVLDYCEPLVSSEIFQAVEQNRHARAAAKSKARSAGHDGAEKLIKAPAPGLALNYPLSGLVVCGACGRSMVVNTPSAYVTTDGTEKRYTRYRCPGYPHVCHNAQGVPEQWLRESVISALLQRLRLDS